MMKIVFIALFIFISNSVYSQLEGTILHQSEFQLYAKNAGSQSAIVTFEPMSVPRWDDNLHLTLNYGYQQATLLNNFPIEANLVTAPNYVKPIIFALGKYIINISEGAVTTTFAIDYRTSSLALCSRGAPDIKLDYDFVTNRVYYYGTIIQIPSVLNVWDFSSYPLWTGGLEPKSPESLSIDEQTENYPILEWEYPYYEGDGVYSINTGLYSCNDEPMIVTKESEFSNIARASLINLQKNNFLAIDPAIKPGKKLQDELAQNYPNPFNPSTNIKFSLSKNSYIELFLYNSLGQKIKTLFAGYKNYGNHKIHFNASELAAGVYYYSLQSPDFKFTKKLLVVK